MYLREPTLSRRQLLDLIVRNDCCINLNVEIRLCRGPPTGASQVEFTKGNIMEIVDGVLSILNDLPIIGGILQGFLI